MHEHPAAARAIAGLVAAALLTGCTAVAAPASPAGSNRPPAPIEAASTAPPPATPAGSVGPTQDPRQITAPPATPTPSPRTFDTAVFVRGWEVCMPPGFTMSTPEPDGVTRVRDGGFTCTDDMNDARVSGTASGEWQMDGYGDGLGDGALVQWSRRMVLRNDGGTWEGTYAGFYTPDTGDMIVIWYAGTGAYEGLSYVQWIEAPPGHVTGGTEVLGLIFPGSIPPAIVTAMPEP